jgi:hypothetical protein
MPMIKCTDDQAYLIELCLDTMNFGDTYLIEHD